MPEWVRKASDALAADPMIHDVNGLQHAVTNSTIYKLFEEEVTGNYIEGFFKIKESDIQSGTCAFGNCSQ